MYENYPSILQTQEFIEEFKKAREMWKENERLQLAEENRRILEFAQQQQTRESDRMAVRIAEEEAKAQVRNDLANKLAKQNQDRDELQQYVITKTMLYYCCLLVYYLLLLLISYLRQFIITINLRKGSIKSGFFVADC